MCRPQFSLKTLLWLVVVVAAFLAGAQFGERRESERRDREDQDREEVERVMAKNFGASYGRRATTKNH